MEPRQAPIKFESYIYPFGINENLTTPPLTIKSIRKLRDDEHKLDIRPAAFIRNTPIVYYLLINLGKKVEIPLLNKVLVNNHTTYSIKGTKDVLQAIKNGESNPDLVGKAQSIANRFESFLYPFVSHLVWFFANTDYEDKRPPTWIPNTPIVYYFLSNLGKKVEIPLLNKVLVNNHTTYSIKGTNDVLQTIENGKSNPDLVKKAQQIENE
ncbi:24477_t:CDS:2 [Racocetra persica]|uniref:24477_t:CDS:1 n=1 Tax=Racocetra persica TaxID=160502 RepID=A0ACA9L3Y9_9GLOM|nr:24477_t:CDS:2 [Racocetra persica]